MGEIFEFKKRDDKKTEPVTPSVPSKRVVHDNPEDELLSPEEENLIQSRVAGLMASHGLEITHYSTLVALLKTLVAQMPLTKKTRLRNEFLAVVRDYTMHQTIELLNNASEADITMRPMFYDSLVLKLDNSRAELIKLSRKRMKEDKER